MRYRHALLALAGLALVYEMLAAHSARLVGFYFEEQIRHATLVAVASLACWTALEITSRILSARQPNCPNCDYALGGLTCPECGKAIGRGDG